VVNAALAGVAFGRRSGAIAENYLAKQLAKSNIAKGQVNESAADERLAAAVLDRLQRYAGGEPVDLGDIPIVLQHLSPFQRRVVAACRAIPYGSQRTYGDLARAAGRPGAARAVGQVMAGNRVPLVVPCHRVVAAGGGVGGFSAPQGLKMKRRLLAMEARRT
jgi:methylated-DNA-[protein]-cysteine S-methyltransferase